MGGDVIGQRTPLSTSNGAPAFSDHHRRLSAKEALSAAIDPNEQRESETRRGPGRAYALTVVSKKMT